MDVLFRYFDKSVNQCSPVCDDFIRKVNYDSEGNEFITYERFDSRKYQVSLGVVSDWNLDSLLKAGINPDFPIHTSFGTRIEGVNALNSVVAQVNAVIDEAEGVNVESN